MLCTKIVIFDHSDHCYIWRKKKEAFYLKLNLGHKSLTLNLKAKQVLEWPSQIPDLYTLICEHI